MSGERLLVQGAADAQLMAVASNMPWQQTLFGCFGNAPPVQDRAPVARREDSAHQHSSSSGLSRSHKSSDPASDSNNDTHMAHVAMSDPFPRRSPAAPVSGQEASLRSASIRVDRHAGVDAARQQARRQRIKQASSREEPRCPSAELEDWHRLKRFAFVGDICSSRGAGTVTKLMLNRLNCSALQRFRSWVPALALALILYLTLREACTAVSSTAAAAPSHALS